MTLLEKYFSVYEYLSPRDKTNFCIDTLKKRFHKKKILVDGSAGVGKGTLSDRISLDLGLYKINTGNIFRTVTWYLGQLPQEITVQNIAKYSDEALSEQLSKLELDFSVTTQGVWACDPQTGERREITKELTTTKIQASVSAIAARTPVRDIVDSYQTSVVSSTDKVFAEGRDLWQVFRGNPEVVLLYLYVSDEEAVKREIQRQLDKGVVITAEVAAQNVLKRNESDYGRQGRGRLLRPAEVLTGMGEYHITIDTTMIGFEQVYLQVLERVLATLIKRAE